MTSPLVEVAGLRVRYRGSTGHALDGVDLRVSAGERVGIVGPSGSGKSTLALALGGLLPDDARVDGTLRVAGVDPVRAPAEEARRLRLDRIAWVFQQPRAALNPVRTIRSHFREMLDLRGVPVASRATRITDLLREAGLDDPDAVLDVCPHVLSGGMAQRVAIALALTGSPDLVIADEPTSALDARTQRAVLDLLLDLSARRGAALVFIAHDLALVRELCPRIVLMADGGVIADRPASEFRSDSAIEPVARIAAAAARFALHGAGPEFPAADPTTSDPRAPGAPDPAEPGRADE